jgi:hypothetical protein
VRIGTGGPTMSEGRHYRFAPLERRGVVLGFGPAQLGTVAAGAVGALLFVHRAPGAAGLAAGVVVLGLSLALACWPLAGRPAVVWAPVAGRWVFHTARRRSTWSPDGVLAPPGVDLMDAPGAPGDDPLGVVRDRMTGSWSAVIAVSSGSFHLLDADAKERRLGAWGAVLAGAARAGSPIFRLQWVERTRGADGDALGEYLDNGARPDGRVPAPGTGRLAALDSYAELIGQAGARHQVHEVLLVVSVHPRRASRQVRTFGRGGAAVCSLLRREVRLLQGQLRNAEVQPGRPLDLAQLAGAVRLAVQPSHRPHRRAGSAGAWPMGIDEHWAAVQVDDRWHATYWIAEWPRIEVGADFLAPLLVVGGTRAVSLTMAPVPPARALREVESARTAELADAELRRRAGFLSTIRHRREAEGSLQREQELVDGHGDYRFCGYVTASARSETDLDGVCAELEQAAQQSHLDLRRLYGQQREALTWTMPLGRGLS